VKMGGVGIAVVQEMNETKGKVTSTFIRINGISKTGSAAKDAVLCINDVLVAVDDTGMCQYVYMYIYMYMYMYVYV